MANLPIKILKDEDQKPFIPFVTANAVLLNGSTHNWEEEFTNRYTKSEVDAKFEALGTIMEFKGTVPTVGDLPTTATNGDVYLVGINDPEAFIYIDGVWEDLGKMVDLSAYSTTTEVQSLINSAIATERDNTTVAINNAMNNAVALAKDYTDDEILTRQPMLESGVNIKTINDIPVIGSGNIVISGGGSSAVIVEVNVATPGAATAKLGTTVGGNYTPAVGDELVVTFENYNTKSLPTLNIDNSGDKPIKLGSAGVTNVALTGGVVRMWYDGTNYQMYGSQRLTDSNTTYPLLTEENIDTGTNTTVSTINAPLAKYMIDKAVTTADSNASTLINSLIKVTTTGMTQPVYIKVGGTEPSAIADAIILWYE